MNQIWRLDHLYWIRNEKGQRVKFKANPVQCDLYINRHCLEIILKSRQHGVTTYYCILGLDEALFKDNFASGIIAHNRDDAQAFFKDKVKYAYDNLDPRVKAILPTADTDSANMLRFSNGSSIRVGTSLRSGTFQRLHISEFGKVCAKFPEKADEIVSGALNTVHAGQSISIESTAEGNSGHFYDYCMTAQKKAKLGTKLSDLDFKFFFFPWWKDKRNQIPRDEILFSEADQKYFDELEAKHKVFLSDDQKAWYVKKAETQKELMKREHPSTPEEAFEAAIEGAYFAKEMHHVYKERRICSVPYNPDYPVDTWWDIGRDMMSVWFVQEIIPDEIRVIDYWARPGESIKSAAQMLKEKKYKYGFHWAPHDMGVHSLSDGEDRKTKAARDYGLVFEIADKLAKDDQRDAARDLLAKCWFDEEKTKAEGVRSLENYRRLWNDKKQDWESEAFHDWASHGADAYMTGAVSYKKRNSIFGKVGRTSL